MEERLKRIEEKFAKQELEVSTLKKDLEVQRKRNDMLESEIQKTREFRQHYEGQLGLLDILIEKREFEKQDKAKFQEENR